MEIRRGHKIAVAAPMMLLLLLTAGILAAQDGKFRDVTQIDSAGGWRFAALIDGQPARLLVWDGLLGTKSRL